MSQCYFCNRRVWFFQQELWGFHLACYRQHIQTLLTAPDPMERTYQLLNESTPGMGDEMRLRSRASLLAEVRDLQREIPRLNISIPLT